VRNRAAVCLLDVPQAELSSARPESLCGVNVVLSDMLSALGQLSDDFEFSILSTDLASGGSQLATKESASLRIPVLSYDQFLARHQHRDDVIVQSLGHRIDRAAALRKRGNNHKWCVLGMTHDLYDSEVFDALLLYGAVAADSDTVVCASRCAQRIMSHYRDCVISALGKEMDLQLPLIHHGVDVRRISRCAKEAARQRLGLGQEPVFLYFGRLSLWQKADLIGLLRCFARVFCGRAATLILAGGAINPKANRDLEEIDGERQRVAQLLGESAVRLHVNVDGPLKNDLFSAADVFVSPANSLQETFGLSLAEAMLYQLPVIATEWSGYTDIVVTNETGYLVPVRKIGAEPAYASNVYLNHFEQAVASVSRVAIDWADFGRRMECLANSRSLCTALGLKGLKRAKAQFTIDAMINAYGEIWHESLSRRSARKVKPLDWHGPSIESLLLAAIKP